MSTTTELAFSKALDCIDYILRELVDVDQAKSIINSVNNNQVKNKVFLVRQLRKYLTMAHDFNVAVVGGWYGFAAFLLHDVYNVNVTNIDMDPKCKTFGKKMYPNINHVTSTIEDFDFKGYNFIICPSCEHIEDSVINDMINRCDPHSVFCLLSNDYKMIEDHINCKKDIEQFKSSLSIEIKDEFTLELDEYKRFMLIGT